MGSGASSKKYESLSKDGTDTKPIITAETSLEPPQGSVVRKNSSRQAWAATPTLIPSKPDLSSVTALIMAADVGGTNSRLMLYNVSLEDPVELRKEAPGKEIYVHKYANVCFAKFADVVDQFFKDARMERVLKEGTVPEVACLAVAGVAQQNKCRLTNLDWLIDGPALQSQFGIAYVEVINDFVAQGYGVLTLDDSEVVQISGPEPLPGAIIACVGAGTGLGQCFLAPSTTGEYQAFPSEGGHAEFAPCGAGNDETQMELLKYLKVKFSGWNRISFERVVSGKGICNIYEFLAYQAPHAIDKLVHKQHLENKQDTGIIAQNAKPGTICEEALKIFAKCYGTVCGTFALQIMPFGGFYLTGGVTHRLQNFLTKDSSGFLEAFMDKGRVSAMLEDIPLFFVKGDEMGQRGAHLRAVRLVHHRREGLQMPAYHKSGSREVHLPPPRESNLKEVAKYLAGRADTH